MEGQSLVAALVPHALNAVEDDAVEAEDGTGVAGAEGFHHADGVEQVERQTGRVELAVDASLGIDSLHLVSVFVDADAELVEQLRLDAHAGCQFMATEGVEHVPAGVHGVVDGKAFDTAGGTLAEVSLVGQDDDRAQIALQQFGGDNAEDPFMPAFAADDKDGQVCHFRVVLQVRDGLREDLVLFGVALRVHDVDFFRHLGCGVRVVCEQQVQGPFRGAHAAGRVDAGRDAEGDAGGVQRFIGKTSFLEDGLDAGFAVRVEQTETVEDDLPVFPDERHHIGNGTDGGDVRELLHDFLVGALHGAAELQCHSAAGIVFKGAVPVVPVRVDDGHAVGQFIAFEMVVGDDELHALLFDVLRLFHGRDTVIDGHDEFRAGGGDPVHDLIAESVAVPFSLGKHVRDVRTLGFQVRVKDGR